MFLRSRVIASLVSIMILTSMFVIVFPEESHAWSKTYTNLNSLPYNAFDVVAYGNISAVKQSGKWYYKFTRSGNTVLISVSAFEGKSSTSSTSSINKQFTDEINSSKGTNSGAEYVYRQKSQYNEPLLDKSKCVLKPVHSWSISKYWLYEGFDKDDITLECHNKGAITLAYHTYIRGKYKSGAPKPVKPGNAKQYIQALSRSTSNDLRKYPTFTVSIVNTGKNSTYLNRYQEIAYGYNTKKGTVQVADLIGLTTKVAKCGAGIVNPGTGGIKDCAGALLDAAKISYKASAKDKRQKLNWGVYKYLSGKSINGSKAKGKTIYTYTATFKTPVYFKTKGDYFQVKADLKGDISYSKPATKFNISFTMN